STTRATPPGTYTITLTGNSTIGSHVTTLTLIVTPPADFSLTANPAGLIIVSGTSAASTISISPFNGFTAPVNLNATAQSGFTTSSSAQTFTLTFKNTGVSPAYVQLLVAANSTTLTSFFNIESRVILLSPGTSMTITLSQPFNATSIGLKFNFTIQLFYGTGIGPSGIILSPHALQVVKGSFTVVR